MIVTDIEPRYFLLMLRVTARVCHQNGAMLPEPLQDFYTQLKALSGQEETNEETDDDPAQDAPMAPLLLTYHESAQRLNVSERTVRRAVREGLLEVTRIGRTARISPDALEEFIETQRAGSRSLGRFKVHD